MRLRKIGILLLLTLLALAPATPLFAQQPATQTPDSEIIRINTNLVQLRVVVTDKSGKPVENLKQEDFEVLHPACHVSDVVSGNDLIEPRQITAFPHLQTTSKHVGWIPTW